MKGTQESCDRRDERQSFERGIDIKVQMTVKSQGRVKWAGGNEVACLEHVS